jgi:hypothetical protein
MDVLVLRLIHIGAGAFWVGAVFTFFLFVQPAAKDAGPGAVPFTYQLLHHRRLPLVILASAATTVVVGVWLLVLTSNGLDPDRLFDEHRLGYTAGGIVAILTFGIGSLYVFPRTRIVERILGSVVAERRPPTADEQQALGRAGGEARRAGWLVIAGLTLAVFAMATARLWGLFL